RILPALAVVVLAPAAEQAVGADGAARLMAEAERARAVEERDAHRPALRALDARELSDRVVAPARRAAVRIDHAGEVAARLDARRRARLVARDALAGAVADELAPAGGLGLDERERDLERRV